MSPQMWVLIWIAAVGVSWLAQRRMWRAWREDRRQAGIKWWQVWG